MFAEGDLDRAVALLDDTYELAKRVGDRDVQMLALSGKGRALSRRGRDRRRARAPRRGDGVGDVRRPSRPLRPGSCTASRSAPARTWETSAAQPSGRRPRTASATSSTSAASPAPAVSTVPRCFGCAVTGRPPRRRRSRPARSSTTSTAPLPRSATTRSPRSAVAEATSRAPRRRTPGQRARPRAAAWTVAPPPRGGEDRRGGRGRSHARCRSRSTPFTAFADCPRRSRSRPRPATRRRRALPPTKPSRSSTRTRSEIGARPHSTQPSTSRAGRS